jgi:hypothetical protein
MGTKNWILLPVVDGLLTSDHSRRVAGSLAHDPKKGLLDGAGIGALIPSTMPPAARAMHAVQTFVASAGRAAGHRALPVASATQSE